MVSEHSVKSYGCYNAPVDCVACVSGTKVIWMPLRNYQNTVLVLGAGYEPEIREVYLFCLLEVRVGEDVLANACCLTDCKISHAKASASRLT